MAYRFDEEKYKRLSNELFGPTSSSGKGRAYYRELGTKKYMAKQAEKERKSLLKKGIDPDTLGVKADGYYASKKTAAPKKQRTFLDDVLDPLKFFGKGVKNVFDGDPKTSFTGAFQENVAHAKKTPRAKSTEELNRGAARILNSVTLGGTGEMYKRTHDGKTHRFLDSSDRTFGGKATDFLTDTLGYLVPGTGLARVARGVGLGAKAGTKGLKRVGQTAAEGAAIGGAMSAAEVGIREGLNPNDYTAKDNLKHIGLNVALGAVVDPAADALFRKIAQSLSHRRPADALSSLSETLGNNMDFTSTPGTSPKFGVSSRQRMEQIMRDIDLAGKDVMAKRSSFVDDALSKTDPQDFLAPYRNRDLTPDDVRVLMKEASTRESALASKKEAYLSSKPEYKQKAQGLKAINEAHAQYKGDKDFANQAVNFFLKHGKFSMGEAEHAEFGPLISSAYRVGKGKEAGMDIYKMADIAHSEGMIDKPTPDELVNLIGRLDKARKSRLKDYIPKEYEPYANKQGRKAYETELKQMQDALEKEFHGSPEASQLSKELEETLNLIKNPQQRAQATRKAQEAFEQSGYYKAQQKVMEALQSDYRAVKRTSADESKIVELSTKDLPGTKAAGKSTNVKMKSGAVAGADVSPVSGSRTDVGGYKQRAAKKEADAKYGETTAARKFNKFLKEFVDDSVYVKVAEQETTGRARFGAPGEVYKALQNARGSLAGAEYAVRRQLLPIFAQVEKKGISSSEALDYMYARHFDEIKVLDPDYQVPSKFADAERKALIDKYGNNKAMKEFVSGMQTYFKHIRRLLVDADLMSPDKAADLEKTYPHYLPKFRLQDADAFDKAYFADFDPINTMKRPKSLKGGSEDDIKDPLQSIFTMTSAAYRDAANNKVYLKLEKLAAKDMEKWVGLERTGRLSHEIKYKLRGKEQSLYVNKEMAEALASGTSFEKDMMITTMKRLSKLQRTAITGSPAFAVRNFIRDTLQGFPNSRAGMRPQDIATSFLELIKYNGGKDSKLMEMYAKSGASMNSVWSQDSRTFLEAQKLGKQVKGFKDVTPKNAAKIIGDLLNAYRSNFLDSLENTVKLAEFKATLQKGGSLEDAAFNARDITDFYRSGSTIRALNPYVAFINATIRGREKALRSIVEPFADKEYGKAFAALTRHITLAAGPTLLGVAIYSTLDDDDERKKIIDEAPSYLRDSFWLFPMPGSKTDVLRVPKMFDTAAWVSSPLEAILYNDPDKDNAKSVREWVVNNILLDPSLTVLTPYIEANFNKDSFTGAPIANESKPLDEQTDVHTSATSENVAKALRTLLGISPQDRDSILGSPKKIDHILKGMLPGMGEQALGLSDRVIGQEKARPEGSKSDPITDIWKQFRVKGEGRSTPLIGDMIDARTYINYKSKKAGGRDALGPEDAYAHERINHAYKAFSDLSAEIKNIDNDPSLSPKEKKTHRNQLIEERNSIVRELKEEGLLKQR